MWNFSVLHKLGAIEIYRVGEENELCVRFVEKEYFLGVAGYRVLPILDLMYLLYNNSICSFSNSIIYLQILQIGSTPYLQHLIFVF